MTRHDTTRHDITLHYHTYLHCIALHYITSHYIALHYTTLHRITLHYIALHCITLHYHTYLHYMTWHDMTLHYITLPYILTLHYITLHYITLHYITLHYTTLQYITLHYNTLHYIHYITLHCVTLHYIAIHTYITLHYITLYSIALHCIALHYITLRYVTLHYITLYMMPYLIIWGIYISWYIRALDTNPGRCWRATVLQLSWTLASTPCKKLQVGWVKVMVPEWTSDELNDLSIWIYLELFTSAAFWVCVLSHGFPLSSILAPAHLWIIQARNSEHHADKPSVPRMNQLVLISTWKSSFCEFKRNEFSGTNRAPSSAQNDWSIGWDQDLFNRLAVADLVQEWNGMNAQSLQRSSNMSNWAIPSLTCIKIQDLPPAFYRAWHLAYSEMGLSHEGQDISNNVCLIRLIGKLWRRDMFKQTTNLQVTIAFNALVRHHGLLWALWSFQRIVSMGTCEDHLVTWGLHTAKCPFSDETAQPFDSFLFLAWYWWLVMQCHTASKTSDGAWLKE